MKIAEFFEANNCYIQKTNAIVTRCPFCGDSQKPHHLVGYGQFYLYDDGFAKCYRCGKYVPNTLALQRISQKISQPIPDELQRICDIQDSAIIEKFNNQAIIYSVLESDIEENPQKIDYLKTRTYYDDIDLAFLKQWSVVLNLEPYEQQIPKYILDNRHDFIGFLTRHRFKLVLRNINKKTYRHVSLTDTFQPDYYTSNNFEDKFLESKTVVIGEGVFSILNKNLQEVFSRYALVAALSKTSFYTTIKRIFIDQCIKFRVIILKEKDVPLQDLKQLHTFVKNYITSFEVYENVLGKDTGDDRFFLQRVY